MPLPVITNVFRCALEWDCGAAGHAVNVIHVLASTPPEVPGAVFTALDNWVTRPMWDLQSDQAVVNNITITPLDGTSSSQTFSTGGVAKWSGNGGSGPTPAVANIIKLQTGLRGRDKRGRIFLPFVAEGEMDKGKADPTALAAIQTAWDTFNTNLAAGGGLVDPFILGVASYKHSHFQGLSSLVAESALATQKRRQDRLR